MAVNYFFSTTDPDNTSYLAPATGAAGNSPTTLNSGIDTNVSYDAFEFRISTGISVNTTPTKEQAQKFLIQCILWLYDGQQGLDALLAANSATVAIP